VTCKGPVSWGSVRISYTWSKAIDDVGEFFSRSPVNDFVPRVDRSRSDDHQRHRVVFNASLNSPTSSAHNVADQITHGWRLGGILQYYSRLPYNIITGAITKQARSQRPCAPGFNLTGSGGFNPFTEALSGGVIERDAWHWFQFLRLECAA
jgi:hypothetical protein